MAFRPLHDRILVRRIEADEKTAGGIIIPDTAKEKPQEGEVIAIGSGARDDAGKLVELDVRIGDRILFGKWSGTEIKLDGEDLIIMKESDVMGVIEQTHVMKKAAQQGLVRSIQSRKLPKRGVIQWLQKKSSSARKPASGCCAASIFWPTR